MRIVICWLVALNLLAGATYLGFRGIEASYATMYRRRAESLGKAAWRPSFDLVETFDRAAPLTDGALVTQEFVPDGDVLSGLKVQMVTGLDTQEAYRCAWTLHGKLPDGSWTEPLRAGSFSSIDVGDWGYLPLRFDRLTGCRGRAYVLVFRAPEEARARAIGVPLYRVADGAAEDGLILWTGRQGDPASTRKVFPDLRIRMLLGLDEKEGRHGR